MMNEQSDYAKRQQQVPEERHTEQDHRTRAQQKTKRRIERRLDRPRTTLLDHCFDIGGGSKKGGRKGRGDDLSDKHDIPR